MDRIKILHTGDLHLGMPFTGSKLPPPIGRIRRQELRETFDRIISIAKSNKVDLMLIAGDLFEHEYCTLSDIKRIDDRFAGIPNTYVVIAPGNHDPVTLDSFYNTYKWEPNVHIFKGNNIKSFRIEELNTTVWGIGWKGKRIKRAIFEGFKAEDDGINILIAHCDVVSEGSSSDYLPMYPETLYASGVHYAALGHIHRGGRVKQGNQGTAFYCGSPEPLDFSEGGRHGIYLGTLGRDVCNVEFLPIAKRRFITERVIADAAGDTATIIETMAKTVTKHGGDNIYRFVLEGPVDTGVELDIPYLEQNLRAFHAEIKNDTYPGYDLNSLIEEGENSIAGVFVSKLMEQIKRAGDEGERTMLKRALYIGLDALGGRKVIRR